jgi:hypothetical protein
MKKAPTHVTRRVKQRGQMVRVIGAQELPEETISESELSKIDAYITDTELADWAQDFQLRQQEDKPFQTTEEDAIYLSIVLGDLQQCIFNGVYPTTKENPVYAMEAFVETHKRGIYPPLWVLDWLQEAFEKYLTSPDVEDLAKLLKTNRGKGKTTAKNEAQMLLDESSVMQQILWLNIEGISIEKAAALVTERLEEQQIECLTPETFARRFSRRGWSSIARAVNKANKKSSGGKT